MKLIIFLSFFFSFLSFAKTYKINGDLIEFKKHQTGLLVSNCKKECEALKVIKISKYDPSKIKRESAFVGSLGTEACRYKLDGASRLGVNLNKDGRDFCLFKDQSMVEMDSLSKYIQKNKIKE